MAGSTQHIPPPQVHILFYFHKESEKKKKKSIMVHKALLWPLKIKQPCTAMLLERPLLRKKKSPISHIMKYLLGLRTWANAQHTHQHTWWLLLLLLLLRRGNSQARFTSAWVWACWWDRGDISQRIGACWAPPCPCKLTGVSCFTAISAFGKAPSNSLSQTHCPESVLLSVYKN